MATEHELRRIASGHGFQRQQILFVLCFQHIVEQLCGSLAAGYWLLIADLSSIPLQTANNIAIVPSGGIITADVQDAMYGFDARITSTQTQVTNLTSAGITDSSASGRAILSGTPDQGLAALNVWSTGDVKSTIKTIADTGWLMMNDGTIGNVSSGANLAGALAQNLYTLLWTNISTAYAPVAGGRGATAAADWAANKPIALLAVPGRALCVAGAGSGLTSRALGQTAGVETQAIAQANLPAVSPTFCGTSPGVSFTQWNGTGGTDQSGGGTTSPLRDCKEIRSKNWRRRRKPNDWPAHSLELATFLAVLIAFVVSGCLVTRAPKKTLNTGW
jgi:hypothetical protein